MSSRNYHQEPWMVHILKDGGNWDYQIRTVEPHNFKGLGAHMGDANKHLHCVAEVAAIMAAGPEMLAALQSMWAFASAMAEKHGMEGDNSMTDAEHAAWQETAGATSAAIAKATA